MEDTLEFRHISVSINSSSKDVYDFVSNGDNFGQWASGLGQKFRRAGNEWVAQGPLGTVKVRIVKRNEFGVADHDVILETGVTVHNPIRVIPNGTGGTVTFTLLRMADVSKQKFNDDAKAVEKNLLSLKSGSREAVMRTGFQTTPRNERTHDGSLGTVPCSRHLTALPTAIYREYAPPPALRRHLVCAWTLEVASGTGRHHQRVLPDRCSDIVWIGEAPPAWSA